MAALLQHLALLLLAAVVLVGITEMLVVQVVLVAVAV